MPKHSWSLNVKDEVGSSLLSSTTVYEDDSEAKFAVTAPTSATTEVDLPVDVSQIISFFIYSDQAVTLKTNSSSSPTQTIPISAKKAYGWNTDQPGSNPLTSDVTKFYLVNASGTDAAVKASFLLNLSA